MKKLSIILIILFGANFIHGQKISTLTPTLVVWKNNNQKISLNDAKYGLVFNDSLTLNVTFYKSIFDRIGDADNIVFEFRWYYYLSTRRSLMFVDKVKYKDALFSGNNTAEITSCQKGLQQGWWEVQVYTTYDNGFLKIGDIAKFQVFIKK
ncbi:MAG: hypothetical protein JXR68_05070 [Bacteroidales bacterium]|nr:hypothetical protein [Bacteroidales bacterium]